MLCWQLISLVRRTDNLVRKLHLANYLISIWLFISFFDFIIQISSNIPMTNLVSLFMTGISIHLAMHEHRNFCFWKDLSNIL